MSANSVESVATMVLRVTDAALSSLGLWSRERQVSKMADYRLTEDQILDIVRQRSQTNGEGMECYWTVAQAQMKKFVHWLDKAMPTDAFTGERILTRAMWQQICRELGLQKEATSKR
jgi:hypothetical protein